MVLKVQEVVYPILEIKEENQTFIIVEGCNVDFFQSPVRDACWSARG